MKRTIVVCAHNEEANIGNLLEHLLSEQVEEIIVVSSSTDRTNQITNNYCKKSLTIKLVEETSRLGMAHAINLGIENAAGDAIVVISGDNLPDQGAVTQLFTEFNNPKVGAVTGHPVPINETGTGLGVIVHMMWNLHHHISLKKPKLSGEFFGFRRDLVKYIPPFINCSDVYSQLIVEKTKHRVVYVPNALTRMIGPATLRDFINQRRRVLAGHRQISRLYGKKPSTLNRVQSFLMLPKSIPNVGIPRKAMCATMALFVESMATVLSWLDDVKKNYSPIWSQIPSTKAKITIKS
jgi:biofilm PGA synthesis N-glycosyltransferase PgaC